MPYQAWPTRKYGKSGLGVRRHRDEENSVINLILFYSYSILILRMKSQILYGEYELQASILCDF